MRPTRRFVTAASLATLSLLSSPRGAGAQTAPRLQAAAPARAEDVSSPDALITALYASISGGKDEKRDWNRFRSLFAPGARLIPTGPRPDGGATLRTMSPDEYATGIGPRLESMGFFEREIARTVESFGNIYHAFSTYESRRAPGDATPFARGINSIQLLKDGDRWWVVTIYWDSERAGNTIPEKYLKSR